MSSQSATDIAVVGSAKDDTITDALKAAGRALEGTEVQAANAVAKTAAADESAKLERERKLRETAAAIQAHFDRVKHAANRHNTPFDGRIRKTRVAKLR